MAINTLDALALASLSESAQVRRIAALWVRAFNNRAPYSRTEIEKWVRQEYGPVIPKERRERVAKELLDETKRQIRLRARRTKREVHADPLLTPAGSAARIDRLLQARLGPARKWTGRFKDDSMAGYIDGDFYSGLVAGLVPITLRTRRISNPNLLVYRQGKGEPRTRYVPNHITTVADSFLWLIPGDAVEFLRSVPSARVEHNGELQAVHLITEWGTKILPWRDL